MTKLLLPLCFLLLIACQTQPQSENLQPVKIIFDSDFGPDYDDVGALTFLHAMADSGKAEILATIASNRYKLVGPGMDVLNTYYGRPDLPMGYPSRRGVDDDDWQHWLDTLTAKYPHDVVSTADLPDAVPVYRKVLAEQPDTSVVIVTVGFMTNLADLLQSPADSLSPLSGRDLVKLKVKRLVSMAGGFPEGHEFNVHMDSIASKLVFENWPTPVVFTGFEIGWEIRTGLRLIHSDLENHPAKDVFRISIPMAPEDSLGRMSWDETAVLIAVYGTKDFFTTVRGRIIVNENGSNGWVDDPQGNQYYVVQKMPVPEIAGFIEDRMMHEPVKSK
jgi:inosine-uridine nucleoside N-ribohydrolase